MIDEPFARGDSPLHQRDPRVKLIAAAALVSVVALTGSFTVTLLALALAGGLLLLARLDSLAVGKRLLATNTFTLFLLITLPLTYDGSVGSGSQTFLHLGPVPLSSEGLRLALLIGLKTNTIFLALLALLATSTIATIGHALESLGCPRRLCFLFLFSYRYIFVIHQAYQKLRRAAELRCFIPGTTLHTYRTFGYMFGMTLVHSWNRSQRIHQAMLLRGFNGRLVPLARHTLDHRDQIFLITLLLCCALLATIPLWWPG